MTAPPSPENAPLDRRPASDRLESWKEIAAYLRRDVSTVQRWERSEGLPVRRHFHRKAGSVYAYRLDIDEWLQRRALAMSAESAVGGDLQRHSRWTLAATVSVALAAALTLSVVYWPDGKRVGDRPEVDPAAYQEYLVGRHHMSKQNEADIGRAIEHFERAARIEPQYAAAYASLSDAWWARGIWGARTLRQVESASRAAAQKSLAASREPAEALVSLGRIKYTYDRDWPDAETDFRRALAIDPDSLDAHYFYAMLLMGLGRFPEAIHHIERAAQLDPLSSMIRSGFGRVLYRARRYDEAIDHLQRAIELEPRNYGAFSRLGDVYIMTGRYAEALASYDRARNAGLSDRGHAIKLARVYAGMGRSGEARRMLRDLGDSRLPLLGGAEAYAALGDSDRAFELLFHAVEEPAESVLPIFIKEEPALDGLHPDARWRVLLDRLNFPRGDRL